MKKKIIRYTSIVLGIFVLLIIYLSTVGIETEKFNNQIQNLVKQKNDKIDANLKKIKLTLDPLNFKINAKTINAKITFNNKPIELEYIQTQISLNSLIKNQGISMLKKITAKHGGGYAALLRVGSALGLDAPSFMSRFVCS